MLRGHIIYFIAFLLCCLQMLQCRPQTDNFKGRKITRFKLSNVLSNQDNLSGPIKSFVHDMKEKMMTKLYKEKKDFNKVFDISPRTGNSNDKNIKRNQSVIKRKLHKTSDPEKKLNLNGRNVSPLNKNSQQVIKNIEDKNLTNRTQNSSSNSLINARQVQIQIQSPVPFFNLNNSLWPFKYKATNVCTDDLLDKLRLKTENKLLCGSANFCLNRGNKILFGPNAGFKEVYGSKTHCYSFGAKIFIPTTKEDFEFMITEFSRVNDYYYVYDLWLPIFREDSGKLVWLDGEDVVGGPYYEPEISFEDTSEECFYVDADGPLNQAASEDECNSNGASLLCEMEVKCP